MPPARFSSNSATRSPRCSQYPKRSPTHQCQRPADAGRWRVMTTKTAASSLSLGNALSALRSDQRLMLSRIGRARSCRALRRAAGVRPLRTHSTLVELADYRHHLMGRAGTLACPGSIHEALSHIHPAHQVAAHGVMPSQHVVGRSSRRIAGRRGGLAPSSGGSSSANRKSCGTLAARLAVHWDKVSGWPGGPPR